MKLVFKVAEKHSEITRVPPAPPKVNKNHVNRNDNHVKNHATSSPISDQSDTNKRPKNKIRMRNLTPQEVSSGNVVGNGNWRQKEPKSYQPGYVEKVNNYIKNSPSIGGYGGINASSGRIVTNYRLFFILVSCWLMAAVVCY